MILKIQKIFEILENRGLVFWMPAGIILIGLLGALDSLTGNEIDFSFFYLAPIVLVTWSVGQRTGLLMSALSAFIMLGAESAAGQKYSQPDIYVLNTLIRAGFFMVVTYLVAELHKSHREERLAARTDFVTGAFNARYFTELLQMEINRIRRYPHPITVVFIDIDNFKLINDLFGHKIGDEVLRCIARELKSQLRRTDVIARLGGDEFVMVLPATRPSDAQVVVSKIHVHLQEQMQQRNLPVTFSMGAVTCVAPPHSAEHVINMADELMYQVKNDTKDNARFLTWAGGNARS